MICYSFIPIARIVDYYSHSFEKLFQISLRTKSTEKYMD